MGLALGVWKEWTTGTSSCCSSAGPLLMETGSRCERASPFSLLLPSGLPLGFPSSQSLKGCHWPGINLICEVPEHHRIVQKVRFVAERQ